jgi:hypothetical protein
MRNIRVVIALTLAFLLILPSLTVLVFASKTSTFTLDPFGGGRVWWTLEGNEKISGSILISHSVKFWITNPEEFIIQNYGILNQTTPFEFTATQAGNYTLRFQSLSLYETKVQVLFDVEKPLNIPNMPRSSDGEDKKTVIPFVVEASLIVVIALLGSLLFLGIRWLKKRNPKTQL